MMGQTEGTSVGVWFALSSLLTADFCLLVSLGSSFLAPACPTPAPCGGPFLDPDFCDSMKCRQRSANAPLSKPISASYIVRLLIDLDSANFGPISSILVRSGGSDLPVRLDTLCFVSVSVFCAHV